jgi:hypothetical protein
MRMPTKGACRYVYRIDARDVITFVSPEWVEFARANHARHLTPQSTIGASLWHFIAGEETRDLYRLLLQKVRSAQKALTLPFRCDSPTCRRFMQLGLALLPDDGIEISCVVLRIEDRERVALLDPARRHSDQWLTICSWCKRVLVPACGWLEIEDAVARLDLFGSLELPNLTGGVCPDCRRQIERELYGEDTTSMMHGV